MKYKTLDTSSISKDNQKRILDIIPAEESTLMLQLQSITELEN